MRTALSAVSIAWTLLAASVAHAGAARDARDTAVALRERALAGTPAYDLVGEISDRIGARVAGTAEEQRAADWALDAAARLGLAGGRIETFPIDGWVRGPERAAVLAPTAQPLVISTLGGSVPTPEGGITAEIVHFATWEDLLAAAPGSLDSRIAVVTERAIKAQDGAGYGATVRIRSQGPSEAARRGAIAYLHRAVGTHADRIANTGSVRYAADAPRIPAAALSPPDAETLARLAAQGPVTVRLETTPSLAPATSRNVIIDIRGAERPDEYVLIAAHIDSWDGGTGALDDGAGIGIVLSTAKLIADLPQRPRRSVRVVLFGAEEFGLLGSRAYVARHRERLHEYVIGSQADAGGEPVWAMRTRVADARLDWFAAPFGVLKPLGIVRGDNLATGGPDMTPFRELGVPVFELEQDMTDYFDVHHTVNDTLMRVDRAKLDRVVAAWAPLVWMLAESDLDFR